MGILYKSWVCDGWGGGGGVGGEVSGSIRPVTKSAHDKIGPCQNRFIAISAHK